MKQKFKLSGGLNFLAYCGGIYVLSKAVVNFSKQSQTEKLINGLSEVEKATNKLYKAVSGAREESSEDDGK